MGYFDFLINKNKEPKVDVEYIYLHTMSWDEDGESNLKYGSIVIDVVKLENDSFTFIEKETGKKFRTNYGWSLAENCKENIYYIQDYEALERERVLLDKRLKEARDLIIDLNGSSRI